MVTRFINHVFKLKIYKVRMDTFWKPIRRIKLNNIKMSIPKSKKRLTYPQSVQRYPRLSPFGDADKDGKLNMFDCRPFDPRRHTTITFKQKKIKVETPPHVKNLVTTLNKKGRAYVVGGFVRDTLLERPPKDIDIEVHGMTPEQISKTLKSKGYNVDEVGKSFGVLKVSPKTGSRRDAIDVSVPRADSSGRKPKVKLLKNVTPKEAASRRDFTINSIMYDTKEDKIVDPYGGVQDLDKGQIKAVSDKAFSEDPLRVIRAAQFASRFNFDISPETVKAAKKADLKGLSGERVREELEKVSSKAEKPSKFFIALDEMGQLAPVFPEIANLKGIEQDPVHHPEGDAYVHTMQVMDRIAESKERNPNLLLAGILHDTGKAKTSAINPKTGKIATIGHEEESAKIAREFMNRLKYPNEEKHEVVTLVEYHMEPHHLAIAEATKLKHKNRLLAKVAGGYNKLANNPEKAIGRYKDIMTLAKKDNPDKAHLGAYDELENLPPTTNYHRKTKGEDLIAQGYKGKAVGERLEDLYKNQLANIEKEAATKEKLWRENLMAVEESKPLTVPLSELDEDFKKMILNPPKLKRVKSTKKFSMAEYRKRPYVKERERVRNKEYYQKPEVKERIKQNLKKYWGEYVKRPGIVEHRKISRRAYLDKPETKEKLKEYMSNYRDKKKIEKDLLNLRAFADLGVNYEAYKAITNKLKTKPGDLLEIDKLWENASKLSLEEREHLKELVYNYTEKEFKRLKEEETLEPKEEEEEPLYDYKTAKEGEYTEEIEPIGLESYEPSKFEPGTYSPEDFEILDKTKEYEGTED